MADSRNYGVTILFIKGITIFFGSISFDQYININNIFIVRTSKSLRNHKSLAVFFVKFTFLTFFLLIASENLYQYIWATKESVG